MSERQLNWATGHSQSSLFRLEAIERALRTKLRLSFRVDKWVKLSRLCPGHLTLRCLGKFYLATWRQLLLARCCTSWAKIQSLFRIEKTFQKSWKWVVNLKNPYFEWISSLKNWLLEFTILAFRIPWVPIRNYKQLTGVFHAKNETFARFHLYWWHA